MRLLVWTSTYGQTIGGGPILAPLLMTALRQRGHEILVVTDRRPLSLPPQDVRDDVRVLRFPFREALAGDAALFVSLRRRVFELKRTYRPQVTHIFASGYAELFHHETASADEAPVVVTLHDSFPEARYRPDAVVGRNLRAASWVASCSASVLETARRLVPEIVPHSSPILNAVPSPDLPESPTPFDSPHLLYVGRLVGKKGVDVAIAAFAMLCERFPALRFTIVGDGDERADLEAQAKRHGVSGRIAFAGSLTRDSVFGIMTKASLVVMPSRVEPFGLVALEAAHAARPVVASAVGGLPEVVVDRVTGLLVPPDDPRALANAIASLLDAPDFARELGAAARAHALAKFRWDGFVDAYEGLFKTMARP